MLILTRRNDESIVIQGGIRILIVDVQGGKVRIGIDAPDDRYIHRQEIYDRIARENKKDDSDEQ